MFERNPETGDFLYLEIPATSHSIDYNRPPYLTGYGKKIPTRHKVRAFSNRWHRVYICCYSNAGTPYIVSKGKRYIVNIQGVD